MKRNLIATAAAAAMFMAPAWAHSPGMGDGMMMGPGMMGGYGSHGMMGPGMMGQGMMGQGMGPGMMGPGMMGGHGSHGMMGQGMGPGMMGAAPQLKLTEEQRSKISLIQREASREHWTLMGKMHDQHYRMHDVLGSGKLDESAARKAFDEMSAVRKQMFQGMLDTRKKIDAVLTDEQRRQLRGG